MPQSVLPKNTKLQNVPMTVMSFIEEKGLATFQGRLARFSFTFEGYLELAIKNLGFILCISFKNLVFTECGDPKVI